MMDNSTLKQICAELESFLTGQKFGKIFPLSRFQLAIDFRLPDSQFLFISIEPSAPRIYLIKRRLKDLEKQTVNPHPFILFLRKKLSHAVLQNIEKLEDERILRFVLEGRNELGQTENLTLVVQLTGRSSNLFLLDERDFVLDSLRENFGPGQEIGSRFAPPVRVAATRRRGDATTSDENLRLAGKTLSESLDEYYLEKEAEKIFQSKAKAAENKIKLEISKREKLVKNLTQDLKNHGDAEKWKRFGDLILANLADAVRIDGKVLVVDYFDENTPTLEIEIEENLSLTEAAEKFFKRYTKARNAQEEISKRLKELEFQISNFKLQKERIEQAIAEQDEDFLDEFLGAKAEKLSKKQKAKDAENLKSARRFLSSEGFEILVGKGAKDNDFLTFRLAKSLDLWMHAADYPGSHVVVRNPNRQEIPPRTLLEAAQIAAFYSQARNHPKAAVHYTQKKHVNKPKGASPGLVSLSSFKTILVEPKIEVGR